MHLGGSHEEICLLPQTKSSPVQSERVTSEMAAPTVHGYAGLYPEVHMGRLFVGITPLLTSDIFVRQKGV